ncbi:DUF6365 family protein [Caballeronia sp. GAFFF3]|uniref:DUF6365 family protein n=1 Tax=Caballeronia sp. GAFFF3 TaxID=2921759 RepID=UPI002027B6EE|nr:DUF6365 family protein [Caballeronia sp. GAFFF3]
MVESISPILLALSKGGWGEAMFCAHLARQLRGGGGEPLIISHPTNSPVFRDCGVERIEVGDHFGTLANLLLRELVVERGADSLVLCDFLTSCGAWSRFGLKPRDFLDLDCPVVGVDTWGQAGKSKNINVFLDKRISIPDWIDNIPRLLPSPIHPPSGTPGICSFLLKTSSSTRSTRNYIRGNLGLDANDRAVLFCTAKWQHVGYADEHGDRCASLFIDLIAQYFLRTNNSIHLIHVGPERLSPMSALGNRYHWLPPLGDKFDYVLSAVDLMLSSNVSATTVSKAIFARVPTIVLRNSCEAKTVEEADTWLGSHRTPLVSKWLRTAVPLFAFTLWPIGFYETTNSLMHSNQFLNAVETIEWLHMAEFLAQIEKLAFSSQEREDLQHRQEAYHKQVSALPSAASALATCIKEAQCTV